MDKSRVPLWNESIIAEQRATAKTKAKTNEDDDVMQQQHRDVIDVAWIGVGLFPQPSACDNITLIT